MKGNVAQRWTNIQTLILVASALFAGFVIGRHVSVDRRGKVGRNGRKDTFSLVVTISFSNESVRDNFLEDVRPLCKYVKTSELQTLSYEVAISDRDPLKILLLERYEEKESAYADIHKSSDAFQTFRGKLKTMQGSGLATVEGASYIETGIGFV